VVVFLFAGAVAGIWIAFARAKPGTDVPLEIAKGLITLAVALLITGLLSFFLAERARNRTERADMERMLVGALQDLKSAHERVQIVQFRLLAEPSPMRLREQFEELLEIRAQLQHIRHERLIRDHPDAYWPIKRMANYIRSLGGEYASNLPAITHDCIAFERDTQSYLRGTLADPPTAPKLDLDSSSFRTLKTLVDNDKFKESQFRQGYREARSWIEDKLSRLRAGRALGLK
jgi:hypothetical protein